MDVGNEERHKLEKLVVLADYLEQESDCNRYKRKLANQEEALHGGISRIYLSFSNIWKPCHRTINLWPHNLRMALTKIVRFISHFSLKLYNIENIFST